MSQHGTLVSAPGGAPPTPAAVRASSCRAACALRRTRVGQRRLLRSTRHSRRTEQLLRADVILLHLRSTYAPSKRIRISSSAAPWRPCGASHHLRLVWECRVYSAPAVAHQRRRGAACAQHGATRGDAAYSPLRQVHRPAKPRAARNGSAFGRRVRDDADRRARSLRPRMSVRRTSKQTASFVPSQRVPFAAGQPSLAPSS